MQHHAKKREYSCWGRDAGCPAEVFIGALGDVCSFPQKNELFVDWGQCLQYNRTQKTVAWRTGTTSLLEFQFYLLVVMTKDVFESSLNIHVILSEKPIDYW